MEGNLTMIYGSNTVDMKKQHLHCVLKDTEKFSRKTRWVATHSEEIKIFTEVQSL